MFGMWDSGFVNHDQRIANPERRIRTVSPGWHGRPRHGVRKLMGPLADVGASDRADRGARGMHLHRVTRDIYADRSRHAVRFPLRHVAVGLSPRDEAVIVAAMAAALAAAVARHITEHLRVLGGEFVRGADDFR